MGNYRLILKRVGWVLIVTGVLDVAYMIYCIARGMSYSSSFNVFAVVAGVFLLKGHLGAVRLITRLTAFMLSASLGMLLVLFPLMQPPGLWFARWRLDPASTLLGTVLMIAVMVLLFWIYWQLRAPSVVQARVKAGQSASPPRAAFLTGALLVAGLAIVMHFILLGGMGAKAVQLAQAKAGPSYEYCITSMSWGGEHGRASVIAYNDHEIKSVEVKW
ncbi:MAG: hypothetical protein A2211_15080 [Rhodanobacter sp. RIFOXYA1_FULL_67_6]|nr:hypothetical protein [Rhodanobacter denitrificans]OHC39852.1 MAG: hypothetical protein A2211_15080 [Rhodanobacter sp. RIFOXYA1_FULL_67_6]